MKIYSYYSDHMKISKYIEQPFVEALAVKIRCIILQTEDLFPTITFYSSPKNFFSLLNLWKFIGEQEYKGGENYLFIFQRMSA